MKLEISQPEGTPHEVDMPGTEVVIGRDPACDIVLSDSRCSRRHAVVEDGPGGLVIRDAGSANGISVNGRRLDRSRLRPGDTVRLGNTVITVLSEGAATVVVRSDRGIRLEPPAPRPGVNRARRSPPRRRDAGPPVTITALCALWALSAPASLAAGLLVASRTDAGLLAGSVPVGFGLVLGAFGGVMAAGLRARAYWARHLQIASAGVGLLVCPFSFASVTVLIYMLRPDVRAAFESAGTHGGAGDAEPTFALSLLGMLALGLALTAGAVLAFSHP